MLQSQNLTAFLYEKKKNNSTKGFCCLISFVCALEAQNTKQASGLTLSFISSHLLFKKYIIVYIIVLTELVTNNVRTEINCSAPYYMLTL